MRLPNANEITKQNENGKECFFAFLSSIWNSVFYVILLLFLFIVLHGAMWRLIHSHSLFLSVLWTDSIGIICGKSILYAELLLLYLIFYPARCIQ